jgi:hypothetical protein
MTWYLSLLGHVVGMHFQGVGQFKIGTLDAMQDHVHRAQQIGQRLELQAVERLVLQGIKLLARLRVPWWRM